LVRRKKSTLWLLMSPQLVSPTIAMVLQGKSARDTSHRCRVSWYCFFSRREDPVAPVPQIL
jgi:hypothetical protein